MTALVCRVTLAASRASVMASLKNPATWIPANAPPISPAVRLIPREKVSADRFASRNPR